LFIADDLGSWLVGLLANAGRKKLTTWVLGTEQERALRSAASSAIWSAATELYPEDSDRAEELARIVDHVFSEPVPSVSLPNYSTLLEALQTEIVAQLGVLDDASLTGIGRSSAELLGISAILLAGEITGHLVREIVIRGSSGGPLQPLSAQLNHDVTHLQGRRIEGMLGQLASEVRAIITLRNTTPLTESWPNQTGIAGSFSPIRRPWMVPVPTGPITERPELASELLSALTAQGSISVGLTTGLEGAGGFGKTTLAAQTCRSEEISSHFRGGLLWSTLGEHLSGANLASAVSRLCEVLSGQRPGTVDPQVAGTRLGELLDQREATLLVIDDVWSRDQLEPFLIGGSSCKRLITTRRRDVVPREAFSLFVDEMTADQAMATLSAGIENLTTESLEQLQGLAGRWPVLLGLINAAIADHVRAGASASQAAAWVAERIDHDGPTALDIDDATSRDQTVAATVEASLDLLSAMDRERYLDLAIFPEDVNIDEQTLLMVWAACGNLDALSCRRLRSRLVRLRLVLERWEGDAPGISLHDVIRSYLRHQLSISQLRERHAAFIGAARDLLGGTSSLARARTDWWSLPGEPRYLWQHLAYHLHAAGHNMEVGGLVTNLRWIEAKTSKLGSPAPAAADLTLSETATGTILREAIGRIAHLLTPIEPQSALGATLASRLDGIAGLEEMLESFRSSLPRPTLQNSWPLPDQPDLLDPSVTNGHTGAVGRCMFSPDGRLILSASDDATLRLWESDTGKLIRTLHGHTDRVRGCAFSPDGKLLVSSSGDDTLRLWETDTGNPLRILRGHSGRVGGCAFSPNGAMIGSVGHDETVRLWDTATGNLVNTLRGHSGRVRACAFSPDGRLIASVGHDETIRLWDTTSGAPVRTLRADNGWILGCAFSPDGKLIASACADGTLRVWEKASGSLVHTLRGHSGRVRGCAFSPDGRLIASASHDATTRLWDAFTGKLVTTLRGDNGWVLGCAFSPDGKLVISSCDDGTLQLWDTATGRPVRALRGYSGRVRGCAFSPDGRLVASASQDATVRLWDVATGRSVRILRGHNDWVANCSFSPDGALVASAGGDGVIWLWDAATGDAIRTLRGHTDHAWTCKFSPDGRLVASAGADMTVRLWDPATGSQIRILTGHTGWVSDCAFSPDGKVIASVAEEATVRLWDTMTGNPVRVLEGHTDHAWACTFSPDGRLVASAGADMTVRLWDPLTGNAIHTLSGHTGLVTGCSFSPKGDLITSVGSDRTIRVWSTFTGICVCALRVADPLIRCEWHPRHNYICVAGQSGLYLFLYQDREEQLESLSL
jgi:WD40 repeat protein